MCRPQCLLALFALSVGVAQSWDIAIITGDQLEFYTNKTKTSNVQTQLHTDMTVLAYDAVHNMLLFVDKRNDNASIFSYHLVTKKYQPLVRKIAFENIHSLAFDPVNSMLFWTDTRKKSIFSMSLKNGTKNSAYGNLWLKMVDETPAGIAVDSCRGYVYWTNTVTKPTIERARFDGTDRKILVNTEIHMPVSLAIDQHTKRLYWADDEEGIHFSIKSSDLEGKDIKNLYKGFHHEPTVLTVSNDSVYWVDRAWSKVWKLPKSAEGNVDPEEYAAFNITPYGIAANYLIQDQIKGVSECKGLNDLLQNSSAINDSFNVPPVVGLFCVNGDMVNNKEECKCKSGYTGIRCNISVCQNFCFQGKCIITKDGQPSCRCEDGFSGDRCEVHVCNQFCLNNGVCSLNQEHKPVCSCATDFEGTRCEAEKVITTTVDPAVIVTAESGTVKTSSAPMPCNCSSNVTKSSMYSSELLGATDGEFVLPTSCNEGWDPIRDPIIMVLGIICGLLVLASVVLFTKILQLKKRPRIKKRIIINKNVTPLTARPDQCEITIENCCNMNICETPCFEPRSTIRPTLLDSKPGKEEKKNLIANMEYPDDY